MTVDDCCASRPYIVKSFLKRPKLKAPRVTQDIRHLCHRLLDLISSRCALYGQISKELHGCITGNRTITVQSRCGTYHQIPVPLDAPEVIWKRLEVFTEHWFGQMAWRRKLYVKSITIHFSYKSIIFLIAWRKYTYLGMKANVYLAMLICLALLQVQV